MIFDGYTIHAGFDSRRFSYRPALHSERVEFWRGHKTTETVNDFIARHVVWSDGWRGWSEPERKILCRICFGGLAPQRGGDWHPDREAMDARNLFDGVVLEVLNPRIARRSCSDCQKWWFNEETGLVTEKPIGRPLLRPVGTVLMCQTNEGCPKGTPENQKALSEKNRMAFRHFQECAATGQFPDDPIVRHNARIIRRALKEAEKRRGRR